MGVKFMAVHLPRQILYISVAQLLLEIQQVLQKFEFFKSCVFVKKCENCYAKLQKMRKFNKITYRGSPLHTVSFHADSQQAFFESFIFNNNFFDSSLNL